MAPARDPHLFRVTDFEPAYLALHRQGELEARADAARQQLQHCLACPRECGVDRLVDERDFCRTGRHAIVSSAFPHHGEEDCLRGTRGSGTIFFSSCNLRCVFCQNADISHTAVGEERTPAELAATMLQLQASGCHNINFVSPSHVVPQIIEAVALAVPQGLRLPLLYNSSGYDALRSLRLLDGLVDIYMPDSKFFHADPAARLCKAKDYPERMRTAIAEMHRQVGPLTFAADGTARRGVLVRHLVMPSFGRDGADFLAWLAREVSPDTYVNIMAQYHPANRVPGPGPGGGGDHRYGAIARTPSAAELEAAYRSARNAGLWRFDERLPFRASLA